MEGRKEGSGEEIEDYRIHYQRAKRGLPMHGPPSIIAFESLRIGVHLVCLPASPFPHAASCYAERHVSLSVLTTRDGGGVDRSESEMEGFRKMSIEAARVRLSVPSSEAGGGG